MYLFFLDGSGDTQVPHPGASNHYIFGGLAVPDYSWPDAAKHLDTVKKYYNVETFQEIKWRHIHQPVDLKGIPDSKQPLINMNMGRRYKLAHGILEIVKKRPQLIVFATVVDKKAILFQEISKLFPSTNERKLGEVGEIVTNLKLKSGRPKQKKEEIASTLTGVKPTLLTEIQAATLSTFLVDEFDKQIFSIAFSDVITNFEKFLLQAPALPSRLGLVIQDEQDSENNNRYARACFQMRIDKDTRSFSERPLLECLSLVPSHHSVGVQIADFCMGAVGVSVVRDNKEFYNDIDENVNKARRGVRVLGLHSIPK
jgi:hypothetical protein